EPFRSKVLAGRSVSIEVGDLDAEDSAALDGDPDARRATLNRLLFPAPARQFEQTRELFGDLSVVDTVDYLYGLRAGTEHVVDLGTGVSLIVGLEAIGEADDKGMRTVMTVINGQLRPVFVRDRSITVESRAAEKADPAQPGQVPAPFSGVVTLKVTQGDLVTAGQVVASIEAMKMEAAITCSVAGRIGRLAIPVTQQVDGGDLLVVIEPQS
ncbi:MAG TPA: biotin/lipoyl-containing protein, partial [Terrimesophilobacter sp.]|nr:biotin/lipoyl-containing protein [Terrimesophilobacter sp.]